MNVSEARTSRNLQAGTASGAARPAAATPAAPRSSQGQGPVDTVSITGDIPGAEEAGAHLRAMREAFGGSGRSVTVEQHRRRGGREQSTLEGILRAQGHSLQQIYSGQRGERLIDRVAAANNLSDPGRIRSGQRLMVPASESRQQADSARLDAMLPPSEYTGQAPVIGRDLRPSQDDRNGNGRVDLRERLQGNAARARMDRERFCAENPQIPREDCMPSVDIRL